MAIMDKKPGKSPRIMERFMKSFLPEKRILLMEYAVIKTNRDEMMQLNIAMTVVFSIHLGNWLAASVFKRRFLYCIREYSLGKNLEMLIALEAEKEFRISQKIGMSQKNANNRRNRCLKG